MKHLSIYLFIIPFLVFANDRILPSRIKSVTVYLSGAQITRTAHCTLSEGSNEITFTGLSHKIDESSIQISGLKSVSILSISYDKNYLNKQLNDPNSKSWQNEKIIHEYNIKLLKNKILGLEEEEKVINSNRITSGDNQTLSLEKVKQFGNYYRERTTAIKNEILKINVEIDTLEQKVKALKQQLSELNKAPETEQGEITIKFDAITDTNIDVTLTYFVSDAGWVPNYDIKSTSLNTPLSLAYNAYVYQKTGQDWNDVNITLSTEQPDYNITKPELKAKYLNFVYGRASNSAWKGSKKGYGYNPSVKKVVGFITDNSGSPLPGVNVIVKGTSIGTQTDFDGNYTLNIPYGQRLVFSYIGQETQELPIYASIMNVSMSEDVNALNEVVVVGQGQTSRADITSAIGIIAPETAVQGKVSGVQIRGANSLSSKVFKKPLYLIDGVPMENFSKEDLDVNEIQDIRILKGSELAIYGTRGNNGVIAITTKKSNVKEELASTEFIIKKRYSISSDGDISAILVNSFQLSAQYEYFAAPMVNQNVFLTATVNNWEKLQLLPGEANIYYKGKYAGKTTLDPFTVNKALVLSLGIDPNITVERNQEMIFKEKSFTGSNRILNRTYSLEIKNNKSTPIDLKLMDRVPISQNKEIKVSSMEFGRADYDDKTGLLTWKMKVGSKEIKKEKFTFQIKYPRAQRISL